ncbi:MAG: hypothetical protein ABWX88_07045 [Pseudoxanthomonas sp.]
MRKSNAIDYRTSRLFLDAAREDEANASYCIVRGGGEPQRIDLPPPIAHRMFRLGQAYGLKQLRYFESGAKFLVGQAELGEFQDNLEKLFALVNDDVLHAYADELICAIEAPSGPTPKTITVSAGSYQE